MRWQPRIESIDVTNASDAEYRALNAYMNALQAERMPKESPVSVEQTIRDMKNIPPIVELQAWAVWSDDRSQMIGSVAAFILLTEDNQHLCQVELGVLPGWRRQGVGTALLACAAEAARKKGRRLLMGRTYESVPAGSAFVDAVGGSVGLPLTVNELDLHALDRELIQRWQEQAGERASDFELVTIVGRYREEDLQPMAEMLEAMNFQPRDDLEIEDFHWTAEQVRQMDESLAAQGHERWTIYARDRETGETAGYTEVMWNPETPDLMEQGGTGVPPKFRNRGLGRWLKAAMIQRILSERPEVRRIQTGNADSNAPMLSINRELGFKPYVSSAMCQVELDRAEEYLKSKGLIDVVSAGGTARP